jgi:uridine phosphorylase
VSSLFINLAEPSERRGEGTLGLFSQVFVRREPDAFEEPASASDTSASAYRISHPVHASSTLSDGLLRELTAAAAAAAEAPVVEGLNACADSFYSSQARLGSDFDDRNEHLLSALKTRYPEVKSAPPQQG